MVIQTPEEAAEQCFEAVCQMFGVHVAQELKDHGLLQTYEFGAVGDAKPTHWKLEAEGSVDPSKVTHLNPNRVNYEVNAPFHGLVWPSKYRWRTPAKHASKVGRVKNIILRQATLLQSYGLTVKVTEMSMVPLRDITP